jgi:hypothetical protein
MSVRDQYWQPSYDTYYDCYFQELSSEEIGSRWQRIEMVSGILTGVTTSGSAIAGWTLWTMPGWKYLWAGLAAAAALISIPHSVMGVPRRVKEQEEIRQLFSQLRVDLETFRQQLRVNQGDEKMSGVYQKLRERFAQAMARAHPDIAFTAGLRRSVQNKLNEILERRGVI